MKKHFLTKFLKEFNTSNATSVMFKLKPHCMDNKGLKVSWRGGKAYLSKYFTDDQG